MKISKVQKTRNEEEASSISAKNGTAKVNDENK